MKQEVSQKSIFMRLGSMATALVLFAAAAAQEGKQTPVVDLKEIRKGLGELQLQVNDTMSALDEVKKAAKAGSELGTVHSTFNKQFKKLEGQLDTLRSEATCMRLRAEDHYRAWQQELSKMGNPKLREKAMDRYQEAKDEFEEIIVTAGEARREMDPFMSDLKDVATYLDTDLTAKSVKSLSSTIWKLGNKSKAVVASIQQVSDKIGSTLDMLPGGK